MVKDSTISSENISDSSDNKSSNNKSSEKKRIIKWKRRNWRDYTQSVVLNALVKNPLANINSICEETWLALWTVHYYKQQLEDSGILESYKTSAIEKIINKDLNIVNIAQELIIQKLTDSKTVEAMKATEISSVAKDSSARYTLFVGKITDADGGMKPVLTQKQIDAIEALKDFF